MDIYRDFLLYSLYHPFTAAEIIKAQFSDSSLKTWLVVPIIPMVTTISAGKWNLKNYGPEDYLLGYNCHLKDILAKTPDSELMAQHFKAIMAKLQPLSRPDESIRQEHIEQVKQQ